MSGAMNAVRLALLLGASLVLSACGRSKTAQCSELIEQYNGVSASLGGGFGDGSDPDKIEVHAKGIEAATKKYDALALSDADVKRVHDDLGKEFATHAASVNELAGLVRESKDPTKVDAVSKRLVVVTAKMKDTSTAIATKKAALVGVCNAVPK